MSYSYCGSTASFPTDRMSRAGGSARASMSIRIWRRYGSIGNVVTVVMTDTPPLLDVRGLQMHLTVNEWIVVTRKVGEVKAVTGFEFTVRRGESLGLVE